MLLGNRLRTDRGWRRTPVATGEEQDKRKRDTEIAGMHRNRISSEVLGLPLNSQVHPAITPCGTPNICFSHIKKSLSFQSLSALETAYLAWLVRGSAFDSAV